MEKAIIKSIDTNNACFVPKSTLDKEITNNACNDTNIQNLEKNIHRDVKNRYFLGHNKNLLYIPEDIKGLKVLDLGCGAGHDVYVVSQLVGPKGRVIGVDLSKDLLQVAERTKHYHEKRFGYDNTTFYQGYLESLEKVDDLKDGTFDIIISNCALNECMRKEEVLKHCHRLLKEGGEFYFTDIYSNRRIPNTIREDQEIWGQFFSGALYMNDFMLMAKDCGFNDARLVQESPLIFDESNDDDDVPQNVKNKINASGLKFCSCTYRLFKIDNLERSNEDYGQAVIYRGTIQGKQDKFCLDKNNGYETGKVTPVCGNTYKLLKGSRFQKHFDFFGNYNVHYGAFVGKQ